MVKIFRILTALLLAAALLTGCAGQGAGNTVHYRDMEYTRPDLARMEHLLSMAVEAATAEKYGGQVLDVMSAVYTFYNEYDRFYTNYALADIRSCHDLTDIYWEEEYAWCMEKTAEVEALLEDLYRQLAASPCREELEADAYFGEGFFDYYDGESIYDEGFLDLLDRESALQSEYYDLSTLALEYEYGTEEYYTACGNDMMDLLAELIALRQEIADYWGYEDYAAFANDFYYYRDYSPEQTEKYLQDIAEQLVPLYRELDFDGTGVLAGKPVTEAEFFSFVREAAGNMGGTVQEAFSCLEKAGLHDIQYGENKFSTSYEIYLPSYGVPFIFLNPEGTRYDCMTFAHEFGHFCNDYACQGSYAGVDVLEFFSQGMEYLSLCYGEDTEDLTRIKMADSLCLFVEQAAFASFEMRMYRLPEEDLTAQGLCDLYESVALEYGFDSVSYDPREFSTITHFYTNPMYIQGYIFSNDAAMQLYQLEMAEPGAGLALYERNLSSLEPWFQAFLDTAGLDSPFREGRAEELVQTFREIFE